MKSKTRDRYTAILVILMMYGLSALYFVMPSHVFSEYENRLLATFPELSLETIINTSFMEGFEAYVEDHFPFRDGFVGLKSEVEMLIGKRKINGVYLGDKYFMIEEYNRPTDASLERLLTNLDNFSSRVNGNLYLSLAPIKMSIYRDLLPRFAQPEDGLDTIEAAYERLTGFKCISLLEALLAHNDEEVYFRKDHHWNMLGAYHGYVALAEAMGLTPYPLTDFAKQTVSTNFNGTLFSQSNVYSWPSDHIDVYSLDKHQFIVDYVFSEVVTDTFFEPSRLETKDQYAYFLDGNHPLITIENTTIKDNERSLLVVKDSYANILIPFLANHYKTVQVIDPRFYNISISDFANERGIDDILVLYSINSFGNETGAFGIR